MVVEQRLDRIQRLPHKVVYREPQPLVGLLGRQGPDQNFGPCTKVAVMVSWEAL